MAENETEEVETNVTEVSENETEVNLDDITYEQALAWKKEAEELKAAKAKAEAKIVELKKGAKPTAQNGEKEVYTKEDALIDKFVSKNPELEGYEDDIRSYLSKGIPLDEVKILVENKDKSIKARKEAASSSILHSDAPPKGVPVYTREMLGAMNQAEYNFAMGQVENGKAILKK